MADSACLSPAVGSSPLVVGHGGRGWEDGEESRSTGSQTGKHMQDLPLLSFK